MTAIEKKVAARIENQRMVSGTKKVKPVMSREHHVHSYASPTRHKAEEEGITQYCCWCKAKRNIKIRSLGEARNLGRGCNTVFIEDEFHSPGPWDHECIEHVVAWVPDAERTNHIVEIIGRFAPAQYDLGMVGQVNIFHSKSPSIMERYGPVISYSSFKRLLKLASSMPNFRENEDTYSAVWWEGHQITIKIKIDRR